jgi:hypothetical protein
VFARRFLGQPPPVLFQDFFVYGRQLFSWDYYRVARRPCGRLALSELGVKVSFHPAQALRTPLEGRRGFETGRR